MLAAYAVLFPNARLTSLLFVVKVQWKTTTYLGLWLAFQIMGATLHLGNIAWWAHIGGFAIGAFIAWQWKTAQRESTQHVLLPPPAQSRSTSSKNERDLIWY